jgi:hypothetical protein
LSARSSRCGMSGEDATLLRRSFIRTFAASISTACCVVKKLTRERSIRARTQGGRAQQQGRHQGGRADNRRAGKIDENQTASLNAMLFLSRDMTISIQPFR